MGNKLSKLSVNQTKTFHFLLPAVLLGSENPGQHWCQQELLTGTGWGQTPPLHQNHWVDPLT